MDVLARLRSDMDDAGREAHKQGENETDACLDILDEFSAEYEVLRTVHYPEGGRSRCYYAEDDGPEEEGVEHVTIIVPRKRKTSLLEAVAVISALARNAALNRDEFMAAASVLRAAAIEKEKSNARDAEGCDPRAAV